MWLGKPSCRAEFKQGTVLAELPASTAFVLQAPTCPPRLGCQQIAGVVPVVSEELRVERADPCPEADLGQELSELLLHLDLLFHKCSYSPESVPILITPTESLKTAVSTAGASFTMLLAQPFAAQLLALQTHWPTSGCYCYKICSAKLSQNRPITSKGKLTCSSHLPEAWNGRGIGFQRLLEGCGRSGQRCSLTVFCVCCREGS